MQNSRNILAAFVLVAAAGCGKQEEPPPAQQSQRQCLSADYVAFDAANHRNQELRLDALGAMVTEMKAAATDPFDSAASSAKFTEALRLYEESASFREKVKGRTDDHAAEKPNVGARLDATISGAIEAGKTATTSLGAVIAQQTVEKTLYEFLYHSVYHEMLDGSRSHWDEAYGYFGAPSDNAEAGRRGLASVATKRDATNGTVLAEEIFNGLVDGSCELAKALDASDAEKVAIAEVPALATLVAEVDAGMLRMLAYSAGHEAVEMAELAPLVATDPAAAKEMWIKLSELAPYFRAVEDGMRRRGGESLARADRIRAAIDSATGGIGWMASFPATAIVDDLETEFSIDIRG